MTSINTILTAPMLDARAPAMSRAERILVWALALQFAIFPLFYRESTPVPIALLLVTTALAFGGRYPAATSLGVMCCVAALIFVSSIGLPLLAFGLGFVLVLGLRRYLPWMRPSLDWLQRGQLDRVTVALALAFTMAAGLALAAWHALMHPDLSDLYRAFRLREFPLPLLLAGAVVFSAANAAAEELMYRGCMLDGLTRAAGVRTAFVAQAIAFGCLHMHGFPRGPVGVGLATVYGLMMGAVRLRAKGLLAPWLAHIVTDMTIVGILVLAMR